MWTKNPVAGMETLFLATNGFVWSLLTSGVHSLMCISKVWFGFGSVKQLKVDKCQLTNWEDCHITWERVTWIAVLAGLFMVGLHGTAAYALRNSYHTTRIYPCQSQLLLPDFSITGVIALPTFNCKFQGTKSKHIEGHSEALKNRVWIMLVHESRQWTSIK